ncbi:OLC1v1024592C1 [Oldenlandia corymbosa var. corymbosa]|uniref:OLC1v1024592C1 n=1 Tax=Oldenlandia corymbosa var. corymbosa TaxID=529605 RepID=A0AAV1C2V3_OLDCO|nr:OLC1v1024592C1 [Oldenlandia corymbosa var. corymbosa]
MARQRRESSESGQPSRDAIRSTASGTNNSEFSNEDFTKDEVVLTTIVDVGVSLERSPKRIPSTLGGGLEDSIQGINLTLPDPNLNPDSCPYYSIISRTLIEPSLGGERRLSNLEVRLRDAIRTIQNSELEALRATVVDLKKEVANFRQTNLDQEKYWEDHVNNFMKMDAETS